MGVLRRGDRGDSGRSGLSTARRRTCRGAGPGADLQPFGAVPKSVVLLGEGLTVGDPASEAADAEAVIAVELYDPLWADVAFYHALAGELALAASLFDQADRALDQADHLIGEHGQGWTEGLVLLLRARLSQARGQPAPVVRAAAERARAWSAEREANMFARWTDRFLTKLEEPSNPDHNPRLPRWCGTGRYALDQLS